MNAIDSLSVSTVYGPVLSWRVGWSLGVDLICETSFCSFNCIYCQLGNIQQHVYERKLFIPTEKVMSDLRESDWQKSDIITFSGSGEPTLALNIGEAIVQMKEFTGKPTLILTNGTTLGDPQVREEIRPCDKVFVKIDAATEKTYQRVNRPVEGFSLENIIDWTLQFKEEYDGYLGVQSMFMPVNIEEADALAEVLIRIGPDEVQLNTPKRPYPNGWYLPSRGSHDGVPYPAKPLKVISQSEADRVEELLKEKTKLNIVSVYQ